MSSTVVGDSLAARKHLALYIVSNAGSMMTDLYHKKLKKETKSANDFVTELDKAIESMALKSVLQQFPDDSFYGEENLGITGKSDVLWIIDPIDGTNNYVRGFPLCGVQIAILENNEPIFSVVLRPFTQDMFLATKGEGTTYRNLLTGEESKVEVSKRSLEHSLIIFDAAVGRSGNKSTKILNSIADSVATVRVFGTAVFDLPAVASGAAEVLVTGIAQPYDIAPGLLLIQEAGGCVYDETGEKPNIDSKFMIFSSQKLKADVLDRFGEPK